MQPVMQQKLLPFDGPCFLQINFYVLIFLCLCGNDKEDSLTVNYFNFSAFPHQNFNLVDWFFVGGTLEPK